MRFVLLLLFRGKLSWTYSISISIVIVSHINSYNIISYHIVSYLVLKPISNVQWQINKMCKMKTRMCVCEGGARTSAAIAVVVVVIADAIVTPAVASACNKNNKN